VKVKEARYPVYQGKPDSTSTQPLLSRGGVYRGSAEKVFEIASGIANAIEDFYNTAFDFDDVYLILIQNER